MSEMKKYKIPSEAEIIAELGCVHMSNEALALMSINPYDQIFICRLMKMRDEAAKDEMYAALSEVDADKSRRMFAALDEQTSLLTAMAIDVSDIKIHLDIHDAELKRLSARLYTVERKIKKIEKGIS